jgi:hypothetical protein
VGGGGGNRGLCHGGLGFAVCLAVCCSTMVARWLKSASGLGRPRRWELTAPDFVKRVEEILGDYNKCLYEWNNAIGKEAKQYLGITTTPQITHMSTDAVVTVEKKEDKKEKPPKSSKKETKEEPKSEEDDDDGFNNIEFGDFDKNKDK